MIEFVSPFPCSFVMNVRRLLMAPSCVDVGQLANQYGVEWDVWMCGVVVGFSLVVPSFASMLAISFPVILECARTLCGVQYICRTMVAMSSLFGDGDGVVMLGLGCGCLLGICY